MFIYRFEEENKAQGVTPSMKARNNLLCETHTHIQIHLEQLLFHLQLFYKTGIK